MPNSEERSLKLSSAEWQIVDAIREGRSLERVAAEMGIPEAALRRTLIDAADKLRMSASLPPASSVARAPEIGMQIPHLDPCPFCENFAGRFSSTSGRPAVIYEDDVVYVFLTSKPMGGMPGHTLVTTRRHVPTVFELTSAEAAALGVTVARSARMLRAALNPEGLLIQQNNGVAAFQSVPHIHYHVVPKTVGPFPPLDAATPIPPEDRAALASELMKHWD